MLLWVCTTLAVCMKKAQARAQMNPPAPWQFDMYILTSHLNTVQKSYFSFKWILQDSLVSRLLKYMWNYWKRENRIRLTWLIPWPSRCCVCWERKDRVYRALRDGRYMCVGGRRKKKGEEGGWKECLPSVSHSSPLQDIVFIYSFHRRKWGQRWWLQ